MVATAPAPNAPQVIHPSQPAPPMPVSLAELTREELEALCEVQAAELRNRSGTLMFGCERCHATNVIYLEAPKR